MMCIGWLAMPSGCVIEGYDQFVGAWSPHRQPGMFGWCGTVFAERWEAQAAAMQWWHHMDHGCRKTPPGWDGPDAWDWEPTWWAASDEMQPLVVHWECSVAKCDGHSIAVYPLWMAISPGGDMSKTQIFQHDQDVSVITDAIEEREFIDTFADALSGLKNGASRKAIAAGFDIVAKLRGYKSNVQERRMLAAGRWPHPSETPVAEAGGEVDE